MDVSFLETQPYFAQNSLQEEKSNLEDNFWKTMASIEISYSGGKVRELTSQIPMLMSYTRGAVNQSNQDQKVDYAQNQFEIPNNDVKNLFILDETSGNSSFISNLSKCSKYLTYCL